MARTIRTHGSQDIGLSKLSMVVINGPLNFDAAELKPLYNISIPVYRSYGLRLEILSSSVASLNLLAARAHVIDLS